eukprot:gene12052-15157_t
MPPKFALKIAIQEDDTPPNPCGGGQSDAGSLNQGGANNQGQDAMGSLRMNNDGITVMTASYNPYSFSSEGMSNEKDGQSYRVIVDTDSSGHRLTPHYSGKNARSHVIVDSDTSGGMRAPLEPAYTAAAALQRFALQAAHEHHTNTPWLDPSSLVVSESAPGVHGGALGGHTYRRGSGQAAGGGSTMGQYDGGAVGGLVYRRVAGQAAGGSSRMGQYDGSLSSLRKRRVADKSSPAAGGGGGGGGSGVTSGGQTSSSAHKAMVGPLRGVPMLLFIMSMAERAIYIMDVPMLLFIMSVAERAIYILVGLTEVQTLDHLGESMLLFIMSVAETLSTFWDHMQARPSIMLFQ